MKRSIEPLVSLHVDFYIRMFIRVYDLFVGMRGVYEVMHVCVRKHAPARARSSWAALGHSGSPPRV